MGIEHKHAYRFVFLKSEKWQSVRGSALIREMAICQLCGYENFANDAHHIFYPTSIWDTQEDDLVILCRACHDFIHSLQLLKKPKLEAISEFQKIITAVSLWKINRQKMRLPEIVVTPKAASLTKKVSKQIKAQEKATHCIVCRDPNQTANEKNIFEGRWNFKPIQGSKAGIWRICEICYKRMDDEIDWSKKNGSSPFGLIRPWLEGIRKQQEAQRNSLPSASP